MGKLNETIKKIEAPDPGLLEKAQAKLDDLTKPQGSLGRLEELAKQMVSITGDINPGILSAARSGTVGKPICSTTIVLSCPGFSPTRPT